MRKLAFSFILLSTACGSAEIESEQPPQSTPNYRLIGGACEGCEAIFEYGNRRLQPSDTLVDFHGEGEKIKVTGTIYQVDGTTPAKDVILYVYHTNDSGIYPTKGNETGWAKRHGYIRGWMKTNTDGKYAFFTRKPGVYPSRSQAAHIHPIVLEPNGAYYWLGSYYFAGDTLLNNEQINPENPRGGYSGVLNLQNKNGLLVGTRDIILRKNLDEE